MVHKSQQLRSADQSYDDAGRDGKTILHKGTVPFVWNLDAHLQEVLLPQKKWMLTLFLKAPGTEERVFTSETVEIRPDEDCRVPFAVVKKPAPKKVGEQHVMESCKMSGIGRRAGFINVRLILPVAPGDILKIRVVDTKVEPTWIIGAREIHLTALDHSTQE